jgi:hypothetical protein
MVRRLRSVDDRRLRRNRHLRGRRCKPENHIKMRDRSQFDDDANVQIGRKTRLRAAHLISTNWKISRLEGSLDIGLQTAYLIRFDLSQLDLNATDSTA